MSNIRDIVNRDIVNLTNCDQEPIHIPGSIQPHGFLVGIKAENYLVDFCSENCLSYTGITHQQLLGKPVDILFGNSSGKIIQHINNPLINAPAPLTAEINNRSFYCTIHKSGSIFIVEAEPVVEESLQNSYEQTRLFLSYMQKTRTLKELCDSIAENLRALTGYDRVMIYRFDEQYNGEVFAESVREDLEQFAGLHYPHTDIPPQARELYLKNLLRLIADINYKPVPIYTTDDATNKNLDLTHSVLRSTSPIHVQYLQNMGVGATLTISLIHNDKLWGLIACHHYSPKNLSPSLRIAAQLRGLFLTSQIDVRLLNEEYDVALKVNDALEQLLSVPFKPDIESFGLIIQNPHILKVCNASGVCLLVNNKLFTYGKTPAESTIRNIILKLSGQYKNSTFQTSFLSSQFPELSTECASIAGLFYHSLGIVNNDCIVWFREETVQEVNWAGDPNKAIIKDEKGLHPRNSFRLWKEVVKCKAKPWLNPEINAATNLSHALQKYIALLDANEEEQRYRKLSEALKQSNDELENINWISTHDLQEPLRKIQIMSSRLLSFEEDVLPDKMNNIIVRMSESANRMQNLLKDILNYTKLSHVEDVFERVDLNEVLQETVKAFEDNLQDKTEIIVSDLPAVNGIPFLIKQLFTNLINNALKFSDKTRRQTINVRSEKYVDDNHNEPFELITIADSGIGFDPKYAEVIFQVFKRLHAQTEYQGSGVGLALCKKIMQMHNGFIEADSKPGEGSVFKLFFPVEYAGKTVKNYDTVSAKNN